MTRTLNALIAAFAVTATFAAATAPVQAGSVQATRGFLSSGHTTGSSIVSGPISGGDLGSGR